MLPQPQSDDGYAETSFQQGEPVTSSRPPSALDVRFAEEVCFYLDLDYTLICCSANRCSFCPRVFYWVSLYVFHIAFLGHAYPSYNIIISYEMCSSLLQHPCYTPLCFVQSGLVPALSLFKLQWAIWLTFVTESHFDGTLITCFLWCCYLFVLQISMRLKSNLIIWLKHFGRATLMSV